MKRVFYTAVHLGASLLLAAACSSPHTPMLDGLRHNRPERVLTETCYVSDQMISRVSPETLITQLIRSFDLQGYTVTIEKPSARSVRLHFTSTLAKGHLQLTTLEEDGMLFTLDYEYRISIARFPATEAQEAAIQLVKTFIQSVLSAAGQTPTADTQWKD